MQLRLECYEYERDLAVAAISEGFNVSSVSKGYANVRQTGTEGTPCEYRYYVKMDRKTPVKSSASYLDVLTLDMLRFLAFLSDTFGHDVGSEVVSLRKLYLSSGGMTERQILQLFLEWKASLLYRCAGMKRGGGSCA